MSNPFDFSDFEGEIKDIDHLKATMETMTNTIEAVTKERAYWKEQARNRINQIVTLENHIERAQTTVVYVVAVVALLFLAIGLLLGALIF